MNDLDDTPRCTSCNSRLWDTELTAGRWACYRCEDKTAEKLREIPALYAQLSTTAALLKGTGPGGTTTPGYRVPPAPLKIPVLSITSEGGAVAKLQDVEDSWRKTLGWTDGPKHHHRNIRPVITFVINNLPWACGEYREVDFDIQAIQEVHSDLKNLVNEERPEKRFIAYCDRDDCDGEMKIRLSTHTARCKTCGYRFGTAELHALDTQYGPNPKRAKQVA